MLRRLLLSLALPLALAFLLAPSPVRAELEIGADAPDVTAAEYVNTEPLALADLSGRLILLELWKTT